MAWLIAPATLPRARGSYGVQRGFGEIERQLGEVEEEMMSKLGPVAPEAPRGLQTKTVSVGLYSLDPSGIL